MKLRGAAWLILLAGMLLCRGGYFEDLVYNLDEAEYAVAADGLPHGWLPGVDFLGTTKPPGIAFLYRLLFDLFGHSLAVLHVAHPVILIGAGIFVVELGIALWGISAAIPAALLFWMLTNSFNLPAEMLSLNVESPGLLFMLSGLWLAYRFPRRQGAVFAAGALIGISILMRQSFVFFLLPAITAVSSVRERRVRRLSSLALGLSAIWIPVLAVYAAHDALAWTWDSWVRYPMDYASDTGFPGFVKAAVMNTSDFAMQCFTPAALAIVGMVCLVCEPRSERKRFLILLLVASLFALASGSRFFGHYWYQVFPVLSLLGVRAWRMLAQGKRAVRMGLVSAVGVGCLVAALHYPTWRIWDKSAPPKGEWDYPHEAWLDELAAGKFVREHTLSGETIVVWGYAPQIYYYAQRNPGVRDFMCHYITGYSPGSFDPSQERALRSSGHPRAQDMFIEDLERRQPAYIFDLTRVNNYVAPFVQYPIWLYPRLAAYIVKHYEPVAMIDDIQVYGRRRIEAAD